MSVIAQAGTKGRQLHKFGGSSLADVKCYLRVAGIMTEYSQPGDMMVVSAAGSTTNQLISWLKLSQTDRLSAHQVQQSLRRYQSELIAGLLPADVADGLISAFTHDLERLAALLDSGITDAVYAEVVGHGEVWSARLMAAVLQHLGVEAAWLDARDFLRAERAAQPQVDEGLSYPLLQQLLVQHPGKRIVVTGFISRSNAGETVLLGRNGSDYSATQIGATGGRVPRHHLERRGRCLQRGPAQSKRCLPAAAAASRRSERTGASGGPGAARAHATAGFRQRHRPATTL